MDFPVCVPVPAGHFPMGCERGQDGEKPVHRVWVDAFEMAICQVRNSDYAWFLESTGAAAPPQWTDPAFNNPLQPVVAVSWFEAVKYCEWLSANSGRKYRLPTEAEWERAVRQGREGLLYSWGDESPSSRPDYIRRWTGSITGPRAVGEEPPNVYGLYDLGDNVHEWCADWFQADYYCASPERNPPGPASGQRRASRGGSWRHQIKVSRCAARAGIPPSFQYADYGFRVVCEMFP